MKKFLYTRGQIIVWNILMKLYSNVDEADSVCIV